MSFLTPCLSVRQCVLSLAAIAALVAATSGPPSVPNASSVLAQEGTTVCENSFGNNCSWTGA